MEGSERAQFEEGVETLAREGMYLYCVAAAGAKASLGEVGLEEKEVYTIPYRDICAVVHSSPAQPYQSGDPEVVTAWAMVHQRVIDAAWERWGTVLPLGFDTIIKGGPTSSAEENTENWLREEYEGLKRKLDRIRGKAEYGIQVFWEPRLIAQDLAATHPEIRQLEEEVRSRPRGLAYMLRQKLEGLVRREMEAKANECFSDLYSRIKRYADDIKVEKAKKAEPELQMLMNLSCLVCHEACTALGEELDRIEGMKGFSVRFTGPWPPYSFVDGI